MTDGCNVSDACGSVLGPSRGPLGPSPRAPPISGAPTVGSRSKMKARGWNILSPPAVGLPSF
eukprot:6284066-Pyramimonas_sp.AAC.1